MWIGLFCVNKLRLCGQVSFVSEHVSLCVNRLFLCVNRSLLCGGVSFLYE